MKGLVSLAKQSLVVALAAMMVLPASAWASDSTITIPTAQKIDTEQLTVGVNTVERQRIQVSGTTAAAIAAVLNSAPTTEYGLVTRNIPSGEQNVSVTGTGGLALDSTLTGGTMQSILRGGAKGVTTALTLTGTAVDADHNALDVYIKGGFGAATNTSAGPVTFDGDEDTITFALAGQQGAEIVIPAGNLEAVIVAESSGDDQTTWDPATFLNPDTGLTENSIQLTDPNAKTRRIILPIGSATHVRARIDSYVSGSVANVVGNATSMANAIFVLGTNGLFAQPLLFKDSPAAGTEMAALFRCVSGCGGSGGTSSVDNTQYDYNTESLTPAGWVYDLTPGSITDGFVGAARMSVNRDAHALLVKPDGSYAVVNGTGVDVSLTTAASVQGFNRRTNATVGAGVSVALNTEGGGSVAGSIDGACTCTIVVEGTYDGTNYEAANFILQSTKQQYPSIVNPAAATRFWVKEGGFKQVRLRTSSWGSGTPEMRLEVSISPSGIDPLVIVPQRPDTVRQTQSATGTSNTSVIAAQGAGIRTCITDWFVANNSATDTEFVLVGDVSGTPADLTGRLSAPNKSGNQHRLGTPICTAAANQAIGFRALTGVTTLYVTLNGYVTRE